MMKIEQLVEVKKGQTGSGLLIESDGYINIDSKENKILRESIEDFKRGDANELPKPFIVSAVFQKYGIENANGRIYPESILKREVEKFQEKIRNRNAFGECYTPDVLCLTEDGWKPLSEVKEGDKVLSLNPNTLKIETATVTSKIHYDYNGKMIRIKGRHIDDLVTPEHKFPVFNREHLFEDFYTANDIHNNDIKDMRHKTLLKNGEYDAVGDEYFVIDGIKNPTKRMLMNHPDCEEDLKIKMSTFMKFMGIYLSEGDFGKKNNRVNIYQVKEDICILIDELMTEIGLPYIDYVNKRTHIFTICDPRLNSYVRTIGNCYTKYIPLELKKQSRENLRLLYDWFVLGDGRVRGNRYGKNKSKNLTDDVFSSSKQLALDLNEIQLKIGYNGVYKVEKRDNDRLIEGRLIKGENCNPLHFSYRSLSRYVYLDKKFMQTTEEDYNGIVECINLDKNHIWYVMSNGKCHWTGNCEHPQDSNVNLERVCMNIVELHWEGHTLVGKLELPISEGFRRYGVCSTLADTVAQWIISGLKIGVSSRGLGSVTQQLGKLVVGEDYEIICWDVVSTPSTPGAYIETSEEKLHPYIQENETKKDNIIKEDKFSKFDKWLND